MTHPCFQWLEFKIWMSHCIPCSMGVIPYACHNLSWYIVDKMGPEICVFVPSFSWWPGTCLWSKHWYIPYISLFNKDKRKVYDFANYALKQLIPRLLLIFALRDLASEYIIMIDWLQSNDLRLHDMQDDINVFVTVVAYSRHIAVMFSTINSSDVETGIFWGKTRLLVP